MEAKVKQDELKGKLAEINQKIAEISEKSESNNDDTENTELLLADYRQKLDQLEFLISNLTTSEPPKSSDSNDKPPVRTNQNTWRTLIDMRLKRAKDIIFKLTSMSAKTPTTTVTKYLPTSNNLLFTFMFLCFYDLYSSRYQNCCSI